MSQSSVYCVVYCEHTLGYMQHDGSIGILHESVLRGAPFRVAASIEPIQFWNMKDIRPATLADFDVYRIQHHPDYLIDFPLSDIATLFG